MSESLERDVRESFRQDIKRITQGRVERERRQAELRADRQARFAASNENLINGPSSVDLRSRPTREMPEARIRRRAIGIRIALAVVLGAVGLHTLVGLFVPSLLHDGQTGLMCFAAVYFLSRIFVYTPKKPTERIVVGVPAVDLRARPSGEPLTVPIVSAPKMNRARVTKTKGGRTVYVKAHMRRPPRR